VEVILGGKFNAFEGFRVGAGVGPGLTRGFGSPMLRVLAALEWMPPIEEKPPPPKPSDRDGDGIFDDVDACPDEPGVANDDPQKHGCPEPPDRDGDGIIDDEDACPDEPGVASDDPEKNGCPPPKDRDGDGIIDDDDACPDEPGVANDDPEKNGCPPPTDRDGDGIFDEEDACPDQAGKPNEDPKKHGCPIAIKTEEKIEILERVEFETNKAVLRPESDEVLEAVRKVLDENPDVTKILVEGHTDDRGADYYNLALSKRRAAAVVRWLTEHGITADRLTSQGFGETKPIDSNDTEEGRQNNRRVEFRIIEQNGEAVKPKTEIRKQTDTTEAEGSETHKQTDTTEAGDSAEGEE
jgi:outer membrane protein OmpA-like peptidoglycan-associated protein